MTIDIHRFTEAQVCTNTPMGAQGQRNSASTVEPAARAARLAIAVAAVAATLLAHRTPDGTNLLGRWATASSRNQTPGGGDASVSSSRAGAKLQRGPVLAPLDSERLGTALSIAAREGDVDTVRLLVKSGVPMTRPAEKGWTPLLAAARAGHAVTVSTLLGAGADVDAAGLSGETALHLASLSGDDAVVSMLLRVGAAADVRDSHGYTALHLAAGQGSSGAVRMLVEAGASPTLPDSRGHTALQHAQSRAEPEVRAAMLEAMGAGPGLAGPAP